MMAKITMKAKTARRQPHPVSKKPEKKPPKRKPEKINPNSPPIRAITNISLNISIEASFSSYQR